MLEANLTLHVQGCWKRMYQRQEQLGVPVGEREHEVQTQQLKILLVGVRPAVALFTIGGGRTSTPLSSEGAPANSSSRTNLACQKQVPIR